MERSIKSKQNILVVTDVNYFNVDKLGSALLLGKLIEQNEKAEVNILIPEKFNMKALTEIVTPTSIKILSDVESDFFEISIKRNESKVREIKWEETSDSINLMIFTEKGSPETNSYAIHPGKPDYDKIVTIGINNIERLKDVLGENASLVDSISEIINIDISSRNRKYGTKNPIYNDVKSYAEAVSLYAEEEGYELTNDIATELISFIYWKTNSLRNRNTSSKTFEICSYLISKGADVTKIYSRIYSTLNLVEIKAREEIYSNIKMTKENIVISRIGKDTSKQLMKILAINPNKNPLSEFQNTDASFVLIPSEEKKTLVLATSNNPSVNLKKIFKRDFVVGDDIQTEITIDKDIESTEKYILSKFETKQEKPKIEENSNKSKQLKEESDNKKQKKNNSDNSKEEDKQDSSKENKIDSNITSEPAQKPNDKNQTVESTDNYDPLAPATEFITPTPLADNGVSLPKPMFGSSSSSTGGNPDRGSTGAFGPK